MNKNRSYAFLISGLVDSFIGGILLLAWLGIIPIDKLELGFPRSIIGLMGWFLAISGVVVVVFQITKLRGPDE